jgi:leucyl-tRNA synthetase
VHQGIILGEDGEDVEAVARHVINPDDIVRAHGGRRAPLYEMFMGPLEQVKPWQTAGMPGRAALSRSCVGARANGRLRGDDGRTSARLSPARVKKVGRHRVRCVSHRRLTP